MAIDPDTKKSLVEDLSKPKINSNLSTLPSRPLKEKQKVLEQDYYGRQHDSRIVERWDAGNTRQEVLERVNITDHFKDGVETILIRRTSTRLTLHELGKYMSKELDAKLKRGKIEVGKYMQDSTQGLDYMELLNLYDIDPNISESYIPGERTFSMIDAHTDFKQTKVKIGNQEKTAYVPTRHGDKIDETSLRMGENKVVNPLFQFNELDDVRSYPHLPNYGRVYQDTINTYFPEVYFEPGILKYKTTFHIGDSANSTANYIRGNRNFLSKGFHSVKSVFFSVITLGRGEIWKWEKDMHLLHQMANEVLGSLAGAMGVLNVFSNKIVGELDGEKVNDSTIKEISKRVMNVFTGKEDNGSDVLLKRGEGKEPTTGKISPSSPDLYVGADTTGTPKEEDFKGENDEPDLLILQRGTGDDIDESTTYSTSYYRTRLTEFGKTYDIDGAGGSYAGGSKILSSIYILSERGNISINKSKEHFVKFLLQKGMSLDESVSNSTQAHPLEEQINQMATEAQSTNQMGQHNKTLADTYQNNGSGMKSGILNSLTNMGKKQIAKRTGGDLGAAAAGEGRIRFPEMWSNSSYSRSFNMTFKLYSPYGDKLSIFENVYVPMVYLMCLGFPRKTGRNSYMSPFVLKAFSKGLFNINLGMITSISIKRGEDSNDRTIDGLFRSMEVSVTVSDLLPTMMLAVHAGFFGSLFSSNDTFKQYLFTLAGMTIHEQRKWLAAGKRWLTNVKMKLDQINSRNILSSITRIPLIGKIPRAVGAISYEFTKSGKRLGGDTFR